MIILPSRGRPHLLQRFFDVGKPTLPGIVVLDDDDAHTYADVRFPKGWCGSIGPRRNIVEKCNGVMELFPGLDWYGITNDDVVPETPGWDHTLMEFAGRGNFAYGDDGINHRWSTSIMGGDLVRCLGWVLCPALRHFYTDDAWEQLREIGLGVYVSTVKVTHKHFSRGAPMDQTYKDRGDPEQDRVRFEAWQRDEWPHTRARLLANGFGRAAA